MFRKVKRRIILAQKENESNGESKRERERERIVWGERREKAHWSVIGVNGAWEWGGTLRLKEP